jgi:hypothetical protein
MTALGCEEAALRPVPGNAAESEKEHKAVAQKVTTALQAIDADALPKERARQQEEAATRLLDSTLGPDGPLSPSKKKEQLEIIIQRYPATKAAERARRLLEKDG